MPVSESQVRPLRRLESSDERQRAWESAVEKAQGQPTAEQVTEAVFEILSPGAEAGETAPTRSQLRLDIVGRLKSAVRHRKSWEDVEQLLTELEELL